MARPYTVRQAVMLDGLAVNLDRVIATAADRELYAKKLREAREAAEQLKTARRLLDDALRAPQLHWERLQSLKKILGGAP
jgi:hypothetical protein